MYQVNTDDYLSVVDSDGNEVLHIEIDSELNVIYEEVENLVNDINKKLASNESEDK